MKRLQPTRFPPHRFSLEVVLLFMCVVVTAAPVPSAASRHAATGGIESNVSPVSISAAYASENLVRPGMLVGVDATVLRRGPHEGIVSAQFGVQRFAPFTTSVRPGIRAMYRASLPNRIGFRVLGITAQYNHTFMTQPVYEVRNGVVQQARDRGYGNARVIATTGVDVDMSGLVGTPLQLFFDGGMSAEPYFGVARFHLELFAGISWRIR